MLFTSFGAARSWRFTKWRQTKFVKKDEKSKILMMKMLKTLYQILSYMKKVAIHQRAHLSAVLMTGTVLRWYTPNQVATYVYSSRPYPQRLQRRNILAAAHVQPKASRWIKKTNSRKLVVWRPRPIVIRVSHSRKEIVMQPMWYHLTLYVIDKADLFVRNTRMSWKGNIQ